MSCNLHEKIENSIAALKDELEQINNATSLSKEIYLSQLSSGQTTITNANGSESIDERIKLLVDGLNNLIDIASRKAENVEQQVKNINLKINVLEEQLEGVDDSLPVVDENAGESDEDSTEEKKN